MVGTGKYRSFQEMARCHAASGAEVVTVAVRRVNLSDRSKESLLDYIDRSKMFILPNTAACYTADDAIRTASENGGLAISAITLWELAWLATHGRLNFTGTIDDFVEKLSSRTAIRPITPRIAVLASQLPATYSKDPSARLIGATALAEGMALITKDRTIRGCNQIKTIW